MTRKINDNNLLQGMINHLGFTVNPETMDFDTAQNMQEAFEQRISGILEFCKTGEIADILEELDTLRQLYMALDTLHHVIQDMLCEIADGHSTEDEVYKPMSQEALLADYGRWVGLSLKEPKSLGQVTPKHYIEEFMESAWVLEGHEARAFLKVFYSDDDLDYWMADYIWRDDVDAGGVTVVR